MACKTCDMKDEWIGDSIATHYVVNIPSNLYNVRQVNESVKVGDGNNVSYDKIGDLDFKIKDRKESQCTLLYKM